MATLGIDVHVHDTYFVIAHFHYIMVGGTVSAFFGGLHYWWPKITGRFYPEMWARLAAILTFVGFNLNVFSAIYSRLSRYAAAVLHVSAGMAILECSFLRRSLDPRGGVCAAVILSWLVADLGQARRRQSLGGNWSRMDDPVAAS